MAAAAGLLLLQVASQRLHQHARCVGGDAESRLQRVRLGGRENGLVQHRAHVAQPTAHRASVDGDAVARPGHLDAVKRHPIEVLLNRQVCEQRRRREAPREHLRRHRRGVRLRHHRFDSFDFVAVLHARRLHSHHPAAPPHQLVADFEAAPRHLALQRVVEHHDALLGQLKLAQVSAAAGALLRRGRWWCRRHQRFGNGLEALREGVQLRQLRRELQLELRDIDALGLRDEEPPLHQLQLELQRVVRRAQRVSLRLRCE